VEISETVRNEEEVEELCTQQIYYCLQQQQQQLEAGSIVKNPPKWGTISEDNFCSGCGLYIWWSTFEVPMEQQS
jgi:hypothetical protein